MLKAGTVAKRKVAEFKGFEEDYKLGDTITVAHFIEGEYVDIAGVSKKRVPRCGKTSRFCRNYRHGQQSRLRAPGSIEELPHPVAFLRNTHGRTNGK